MTMKAKILFGSLAILFSGPFAHAAPAPNPADYPVKVHVTRSELQTVCGTDDKGSTCWLYQFLTVIIDAKQYTLQSERPRPQLLSIGDYQARMTKDEKKSTAEYRREFDLIFSDGQTVKYAVVGESESNR
jgi:hypothetical protein